MMGSAILFSMMSIDFPVLGTPRPPKERFTRSEMNKGHTQRNRLYQGKAAHTVGYFTLELAGGH